MEAEARGDLGLWLTVAFVVVALLLRAAYQKWRFGSSGLVGLRQGAPALELFTGTALILATVAVGVGAALQSWGGLDPLDPARGDGAVVLGLILAGLGFGGTLWAQLAMGRSWRVGVDASERTELVTTGPFRWVRNPIFTAMIAFTAGIALLAPNILSLAGLVLSVLAVELHVRLIEEPYLVRTHGDGYGSWAARTGRFLPGLGRLTPLPPR